MFKLRFEITYADGTTATATTRPGTDVAFERKYGIGVASLFADVPQGLDKDDPASRVAMVKWYASAFSTEQTSYMAWHATRDGRDFDTWLDAVESINWTMADAVDPTQAAASVS